MRTLLNAAIGAVLLIAGPALAQSTPDPQAWIETSSNQTVPAGSTVTVLPGADSALWAQIEEGVRRSLEGQGLSLAEGATLRLRIDITEPRGFAVGRGPSFDLLGGGGDNSNLGLGGRFTFDFEEFDAAPSVPPQRVSMRLYEVGGGTLWIGSAESPLYGRDRSDMTVTLADALIDRLDTDTPRQALD